MLLLMQRYKVSLIVVSLCAVALLSLGAVLPRTKPMQQAKQFLEQNVSQVTGVPVSIDGIEITATGKLRMRNVHIAQESAAAQVTAQADEVLIGLNLWEYLRTRDVLNSISSIQIRTLHLDVSGELDALSQLLPAANENIGTFQLPFPVTFNDITANWQGYTWNERQLQLLPQASKGMIRVSLVRSQLTGAGIPAGYGLSGNGIVGADSAQQLALSLTQSSQAGSLIVSGAVNWGAQGSWQLKVNGINLQLATWLGEGTLRPFLVDAAVTGAFATPEVVISTGTLAGADWQLDGLQAELSLPEFTTVELQSLTVTKKAAKVTVSGTIPLEALDQAALQVQASEIATGHLPAQLVAELPFSGTASFSAQLQGLAPGWQMTGSAIVRQGTLFENSFTTLQAQLQLDAQQVTISAGTASIPGVRDTAYRFWGHYLIPQQQLKLDILAAGIPAQHALAWPQLDWPASGTLNGEVRINGHIEDPTIKVLATAPTGEFWHQPFRNLRLDLEYADGTTTLRRTTAIAADGNVVVDGQARAEDVDLTFSVSQAALDQAVQAAIIHAEHFAPEAMVALQQIKSVEPTGRLSGHGTIKGSSEAPRLTVNFTTTGTRIAAATAGNWSGQVTGLVTETPGVEPWRLSNGRISLGSGTLAVAGTWIVEPAAYTSHTLRVSGSMSNIPAGLATQLGQAVAQKLGSAGLPQALVAAADDSALDGTWSFNLPHAKQAVPNVTANLSLSGKLAGFDYEAEVAGHGWVKDVQLEQIRIAAAGGTAVLNGAVVNNDLRVTGAWRELPAGIIGTLAGLPQNIGGILSGDIDVSSKQGKVQGAITWHTPLISVDNSQLTQVSGQVLANNGRLQLANWRGTLGGRTIQLHGSLPIPASWGSYFVTTAAQHLDLNIVIPQGPLAPLVSWLQLVPALQGSSTLLSGVQGQGELRLQIGGTLKAPQFNGSALIAQGVLPLPSPWGNVEQFTANMEFSGNTMRLVKASAQTLGGQVTAQGEVTLKAGASPTLKGSLSSHLKPRIDGISGEGKLDLQVHGTLAHPFVSGKVHVAKAEINLADLPAISLSDGGGNGSDISSINGTRKTQQGAVVDLNVDIAVDQIRVKAASLLDVPAKGSLQLTGTSTEPRLNGALHAERGRVNYLGTFFTVEQGSVSFAGYQGFMPTVNMISTTWVGHTTIALRVTGTLPQLLFSLASEPYRPQAEIIAMLGWPDQIGKMGSGNPDTMAQGIVEVLQSGIEYGIVSSLEETVRESLGLDEFRIHPSLAEGRVRLSFGKYVLPRIYLTYEAALIGENHQDLNLEYQLDDSWKINAGVRDDGEMRLGVESKIKF